MINPPQRAPAVCAIVPAAGRGSRLGLGVPKVFTPIFPSFTIWDALRAALAPLCDRMVLVLSPDGRQYTAGHASAFPSNCFLNTELVVQDEPRGMGDAIFGAAHLWREAEVIMVVWGDQYNLREATLRACLDLQAMQKAPALTIPLVRPAQPYVEYIFDSGGGLNAILQTREGDVCAPHGFADMGVFLLSGGAALEAEWQRYLAGQPRGARTGEINFLPFLVHLSMVAGWPVARHECHDAREALGINTPSDLEEARAILRERHPRFRT